MARPRAVEEGAKRSRELIEKMKQDQQDAEQETQAAVKQDLADLSSDSKPSGGQDQTDPPADPEPTEQAQGQAKPPPDKPSDPEPKSQQPADQEDPLQKRIRELENDNARLAQANTVLRSKYDAEVPRLAAEVRDLKDQLKQQNEPPAGDTAPPAAANTETVEKIKQALLDEYPSDVVNNLDQLIRSIVQSSLPAPQDTANNEQVEELRKQVQSTMAQLREQQLTALVPDWKKIQADEYAAWVKFLQHKDAVSGRERNEFLQEAWNNHDIERVAEIFNLYKRERDASRQRNDPPPTVPDDRGNRANVDPADPGKKVYKHSYIAQVEAMARQGKFKGRETELERLRKEFRLAAAQGRVDMSG